MTFEQWRYRDPLEQMLQAEARTCKGCAFQQKVFGRDTCAKQNQQHGRRCRHYIEKEGTGHVPGKSDEEGAGATGDSSQ